MRRAGSLFCILSLTASIAVAAGPAGSSAPPSVTGTEGSIAKYVKSTPAEDAAAITDARARADATAKDLGVKFTELQTSHFILFTDWDPKEFNFLKENLEGAYTAVARQFEMSPKDNVFVGKLPVYMFVKQADFMAFASKIDQFPANKMVLGYYGGRSDGSGHMAMWKPDSRGTPATVSLAERQWAYTLTHEFTHAFIARYRSNHPIPRWLNEGMAEVVADGQFPRPGARAFARTMAKSPQVDELFDDKQMPKGEMYPVMMTMVQALIAQGPKTFLSYFNDLKDGTAPEAALQKFYHVDDQGLEAAWKKYIQTTR